MERSPEIVKLVGQLRRFRRRIAPPGSMRERQLRRLYIPLFRLFPHRLPFDVILPRTEALESVSRTSDERIAEFEKRWGMGVNRLTATVENLTRAWLQMQNEIAAMPATAAQAVRQPIADLTDRLTALETQVPATIAAWITNAERHLTDRLTALETQVPATVAAARDAAVASLRGELDGHAAWITNAERHLHDDITGRGQRVDDTLRFLLERVEFVRREMLFELRHGAHGGLGAKHEGKQAYPLIVSPDKIADARGAGSLRLNLGCGHIPLPGYINVDMRDLPGVDVIAECGALPFEPGSVDEIFSAHLVEHFPQEELVRRLLPHWLRLLRPGGTFCAVTPDAAAMLAGIADGSYGFDEFRGVLFGGQDYEGDFHYNLFTPESLARLVEQAGFVAPETPVRGRRNGACFEFELVARAPAANDVVKLSK